MQNINIMLLLHILKYVYVDWKQKVYFRELIGNFLHLLTVMLI